MVMRGMRRWKYEVPMLCIYRESSGVLGPLSITRCPLRYGFAIIWDTQRVLLPEGTPGHHGWLWCIHASVHTIHWYLIYIPCRAYLQLYILNKFNYINFETYEEKNSLTLRSTSLIMQRRQILRATFLYTCTCNMHICII